MVTTKYSLISPMNVRSFFDILSTIPLYQSSSKYGAVNVECYFDHNTETEKQNFFKTLSELGVTTITENDTIRHNLSNYLASYSRSVLMASSERSITLPNLQTTYTNVYPSMYDGQPIPIDTRGYQKMGFVICWNKNDGLGIHDIRLIKCDMNGGNIDGTKILKEQLNIQTGRSKQFNFDIPTAFMEFEGFVILQARTNNGIDSPIFDGLWLYLVKR